MSMKVLPALLCIAVLAVPAAAPAAAPLTRAEAKGQLIQRLARDFDRAWRKGEGRHVGGCRRLSRTRVRCRDVRWRHRHFRYKGVGEVRRVRAGKRAFFRATYRITRFDTRCSPDDPDTGCVRIYETK